MKLRNLNDKDAPLMLEWMHDESIVNEMQEDFLSKTIEDCKKFIDLSISLNAIHLAIVDEADTYMGTVSLKNIENDMAEFAIVVRKCAMGKGYSKYGMSEIIKLGFEQLKLKKIYWYVSVKNYRAIRFYDKMGYTRDETINQKIDLLTHSSYLFYSINKYSGNS